jgi:hypothetical protein
MRAWHVKCGRWGLRGLRHGRAVDLPQQARAFPGPPDNSLGLFLIAAGGVEGRRRADPRHGDDRQVPVLRPHPAAARRAGEA